MTDSNDDYTICAMSAPINTDMVHVHKSLIGGPRVNPSIFHEKVGTLVKIAPCDEKYGGKTFAGIYLGDMVTGIGRIGVGPSGVLVIKPGMKNPAIFVPDLGEIIYGYESWWGEISSIDELAPITKEDIDNIPWVKLLKGGTE